MRMHNDSASLDSVLQENRLFPPPAGFARESVLDAERLAALHAEADADPSAFWSRLAREELVWRKPFTKGLEGTLPDVSFFADGELNVTETCLDRHLAEGRRDKRAIVWEGEPGDRRTLTYGELASEVGRLANAMRGMGVGKGDRVCIYLPMIPEAVVSMLACARLGAIHSVVFAGFSAEALRERIADTGARMVITADGFHRKGSIVRLKDAVDEAVSHTPTIRDVIVVERAGAEIHWEDGRDRRWKDVVAGQSPDCPATPVEAEHPLFILYTSGSTGKPKGVVHSCAGFLLGASVTTGWIFDMREDDVWWCTADVGWVTGHTYVVYGPLARGATVLMYEGGPLTPAPDRFWDLIEKHRVTAFYTAPTAIRTFLRLGSTWPDRHDLSSLRLLGTVGEPINPEAWMWYRDTIGKERCPVVDTWWQTETGATMIAPLPGATPTKPGSATKPLPGIKPAILDAEGRQVPEGKGGNLVIERPWPWMARTIHGDRQRYLQTYFSAYPGKYCTGDGARVDADGYYWIMGRVDDVLNVAGHRLGTMEVESALVSHPRVAEAAVVGRPDDVKGTAVVAFVTLKQKIDPTPALRDELLRHVVKEIGAIARPDQIRFADALPKTRSGKIMRRLLRDLAAGREAQGDVTTLEDLSVLAALRAGDEE
ncbi:MAG TPA: acetate--CoA ligase [Vulgatibacter sp.]